MGTKKNGLNEHPKHMLQLYYLSLWQGDIYHMDIAYLATARTPYGCIKLDAEWALEGAHCAIIGTEQKLTWPYLDFSNGDEIRKGSARPGSYKLVRPVGNGIPLSEV